jgi:uncharacterized protein (TIGR02145 family)
LLCDGETFNVSTQFCEKNFGSTADSIYAKCGGRQYIPTEQFCSGGTVRDKCGGKIYNPADSFCVDDALYLKCNGKEYQVEIYRCNVSGENKFLEQKLNDGRNGQEYSVVSLGSQTWIAENMNIGTNELGNEIGKCYDENEADCLLYGRLYTWAEAMALPELCNDEPDNDACRYSLPRQGICPENWHVPSDGEWNALLDFVGGTIAGRELKAESGWDTYPGGGNGWNTRGFSALPGGFGSSGGDFGDKGKFGYWWSASEARTPPENAVYYNMSYTSRVATRAEDPKARLYSVRCLYGTGN